MVNVENPSKTKLTLSYVHNASAQPFKYGTVAQSFDEVASQYPDFECCIFKEENKRYTYKTFQHEIDCMALALLELGFEKNDHIFVMLPNCSQNVVSIYVAAKLGLVKVHGDPNTTSTDLAAILSKVDCKGIVMMSDEKTVQKFEEASQNIPSLKHIILVGSNKTTMPHAHIYDELLKQAETKKTEQLDTLAKHQASVDPDSPVAIILTSGSTGEPGRVILTNFSVLNTTVMHWNFFGSALARPCATQAMCHISTGICIVLIPSVEKATLVVPSFHYDASAAMRSIHEEKCTVILCGPIFFRRILDDPDRSKYDLNSLKYALIAGALVEPKLLDQIKKELGITQISPGYATTEAGCVITTSVNFKDDRRTTSAGQCMPHFELKLVDENGKIVPIGSQGEIWLRSRFITPGYYKDPEKTAKTISTCGWLKTGDLATMDEDGYLYFIERKKHMIFKQDGSIVYCSKVEQALEDHESVDRAHVFTIYDTQLEGVVCAFVKLKSDRQCEVDELKNFLAGSLAAYKIPEYIHFVNDFPRTNIGKVPKHKLAKEMMKILKL